MRRAGSRGQVLPMWALGIITTFALMFLALNYGNAIRWQIRAQNAADSAAAAVAGIQAERWNVMTATLYASSVEEYRIRRLLDSLLLTIDQSGGCTGSLYQYDVNGKPDPRFTSIAFGSCNRTYADLRTAYLRAVTRYGHDVTDINNVSSLATFTNFTSDANALLRTLQACSTVTSAASPGPSPTPAPTPSPVASASPTCGDAKFKYSFAPNGIAQQTSLNNVQQDAQQWHVSYGGTSLATVAANLWDPAKVDVITCAIVPAIVPNLGPIHFKPYYAIGRAAFANVMVEQDWLQPGTLVDPQRPISVPPAVFQPDEPVTAPASPPPAYNWYDVNFGGETNTAYVNGPGVFGFEFLSDDFEAQTGWWGAIPIRPFGGTVTLTGTSGAC